MSVRPGVFIELRSSDEGYYVRASIEGAPGGMRRTYVGVLDSRDEAFSETVGWALGWLRRFRETLSLRSPDWQKTNRLSM